MRKIKFRAKSKTTNKWVYGIITKKDTDIEKGIVPMDLFFSWLLTGWLDMKTLGQYIEEKDKNEKEIYDEDIVRRKDKVWTQNKVSLGVVKYGGFVELIKGDEMSFYAPDGITFTWDEIEVVGNKFDNKKLMKK